MLRFLVILNAVLKGTFIHGSCTAIGKIAGSLLSV
jgi:hypothetical protein